MKRKVEQILILFIILALAFFVWDLAVHVKSQFELVNKRLTALEVEKHELRKTYDSRDENVLRASFTQN